MELELKLKEIGFGLAFSFFILMWAYRLNFFSVIRPIPIKLHLSNVLGAFITYLSIPIFFAPLGFLIYLLFENGKISLSNLNLSSAEKGWLNLMVMIASLLAVGAYSYYYRNIVKDMFDHQRKGLHWEMKQFGLGLLACLISLPLVFTVSEGLDTWIDWQFNIPPVEQLAVVHLRSLMGQPFLLGISMAAVVLGVPIVEELLFRGFLQTWLAKYLQPMSAIFISAIIFALFHFAMQQSWYNIQIICSLFVLALFLGYIYFRQQSLWAPIALHMLFNLIGVSAILTTG